MNDDRISNKEKKELKKLAILIIEENTNNTVIKSKIVDRENIECLCKNKFSKEHLINVSIGIQITYIAYDSCIFKTIKTISHGDMV